MDAGGDRERPLRLVGGRFTTASDGEDVGFPLSAAHELARYDDLLFEVARRLWLDDHPTRGRIPREFEDKVRLRLTAVEHGSVKPVVASMQPTGQIGGPYEGYGRRSRQLIAVALAFFLANGSLPEDLPPATHEHLARFAQGLHDDETAIVRRDGAEAVHYRRADQRKLHRLVHHGRLGSGDLLARVTLIDPDRRKFEVRLPSGRVAKGDYRDDELTPSLKDLAANRDIAPYAVLNCDYRLDAANRVAAIDALHAVKRATGLGDPLGRRFRHLAELPRNWDDDGAEPVRPASLALAQQVVIGCADPGRGLLHAFAAVDGGVYLEAQPATVRWSLEIDPNEVMTVIIAGGGVDGEVQKPTNVGEVAASLRSFVESHGAA